MPKEPKRLEYAVPAKLHGLQLLAELRKATGNRLPVRGTVGLDDHGKLEIIVPVDIDRATVTRVVKAHKGGGDNPPTLEDLD